MTIAVFDFPSARTRIGASALAVGLSLAACGAMAQSLSGPPGIDYYPPWMLRVDPYVAGRDQDYDVFRQDRFEPLDPDLLAFQREQRRLYGPNYRDRPEYQADLRRWLEERGGAGGADRRR